MLVPAASAAAAAASAAAQSFQDQAWPRGSSRVFGHNFVAMGAHDLLASMNLCCVSRDVNASVVLSRPGGHCCQASCRDVPYVLHAAQQ
jgi:hypothetical protein